MGTFLRKKDVHLDQFLITYLCDITHKVLQCQDIPPHMYLASKITQNHSHCSLAEKLHEVTRYAVGNHPGSKLCCSIFGFACFIRPCQARLRNFGCSGKSWRFLTHPHRRSSVDYSAAPLRWKIRKSICISLSPKAKPNMGLLSSLKATESFSVNSQGNFSGTMVVG